MSLRFVLISMSRNSATYIALLLLLLLLSTYSTLSEIIWSSAFSVLVLCILATSVDPPKPQGMVDLQNSLTKENGNTQRQ